MTKTLPLLLAAASVAAAPVAAAANARVAAPVEGENSLAGNGNLFFLAAIAVVALAVVLLPEDQPASP